MTLLYLPAIECRRMSGGVAGDSIAHNSGVAQIWSTLCEAIFARSLHLWPISPNFRPYAVYFTGPAVTLFCYEMFCYEIRTNAYGACSHDCARWLPSESIPKEPRNSQTGFSTPKSASSGGTSCLKTVSTLKANAEAPRHRDDLFQNGIAGERLRSDPSSWNGTKTPAVPLRAGGGHTVSRTAPLGDVHLRNLNACGDKNLQQASYQEGPSAVC